MAAMLLPPAFLPRSSDDDDDAHTTRLTLYSDASYQPCISYEHAFLRSLTACEQRSNAGGKQSGLEISIPETAALSQPIAVPRCVRSLTLPMAMARVDSVAVETAPSSPPELSYSKSSKSSNSSFRSESLSDQGETEKLSHFEDITLDGEGRESEECNVKPESRPVLKRPLPRTATSAVASKRNVTPPDALQDLPNGFAKNRYPSLKGAVNGVLRDQSLNLPNGRSMRRGFTSPSSPSFGLMSGAQRIPSRSPSPNKVNSQGAYCVSPRSLGSTTPRASSETRSPYIGGPLSRRQSWQPNRKTVKELEAEYDDKDDDLPEEVVLENVPISSPVPPSQRSTTPSPQRHGSHVGHGALATSKRKHPSAPAALHSANGSPRSPRNMRRPHMMPHSATVASYPHDAFSHKPRTKSWTADLSEEARQLSQALEEYADTVSTDKTQSSNNSATNSPPRPDMAKMRAKTSVMEFPPVQKGDIMIDPLPISKEKEKVLTRTRPSWLPPKSQKEEKKHLKEWERMMAQAAEAEKKRAAKQLTEIESKNETQGSIARIWEQHVLPNWTTVINEPRTRELWWRGVTSRNRGQVWQRAIGNELDISASSFEAALIRARALEEKVAEMPAEERSKSKEAAWFDAIARDVPTVFPELGFFAQGSQLHAALLNVLKAYAMYRSDVGYVYGTHLIAGLLALNLQPAEAFVTLANMLNRPLPLAFLVHDVGAMDRTYELVLSALKYKFTKLHDHLTAPAIGLRPADYLEPLFRTLFACNLPPEHVSRVWDVFVFEGDKALIRTAVAVLGKLESRLYGSRDEVLDVISWRAEARWSVGDEEDFMRAVRDAGKMEGKAE